MRVELSDLWGACRDPTGREVMIGPSRSEEECGFSQCRVVFNMESVGDVMPRVE